MTISRRGRFFVPDTEERQGKETENLSLFLFSFCGFLEQSGNLFCQCHDGQNRRVAHCFRQDRGVRHVEIVRKPGMMQGVFFCPCQRQQPPGWPAFRGPANCFSSGIPMWIRILRTRVTASSMRRRSASVICLSILLPLMLPVSSSASLAFREAKLESPNATLSSHHGQGVTSNDRDRTLCPH